MKGLIYVVDFFTAGIPRLPQWKLRHCPVMAGCTRYNM